MIRITTVGLDADDTLWHNETIFRLTQDRFRSMMADVAAPEVLDARLAAVEKRNMALYGYGVKGFTLSMIETAMEVTGGEPNGRIIADILAAGREMLAHPVEPLPGVAETLAELVAKGVGFKYFGRTERASPAIGSPKVHQQEQTEIIKGCFK